MNVIIYAGLMHETFTNHCDDVGGVQGYSGISDGTLLCDRVSKIDHARARRSTVITYVSYCVLVFTVCL